ncbi:hypothetical protein ID866_7102, partial [Astraeus odoratus]
MATRAVKRFRIKEVISARAPSSFSPPPFTAPTTSPFQATSAASTTKPFPAALRPFQFQHPFQLQIPPTPNASRDVAAAGTQGLAQPQVSTAPRHVPRRTNPFVPQLNTKTGKWAPPKYSLRQQADLIKKARKAGMLDLLPPSIKTTKARERAVVAQAAQPILQGQLTGAKAGPINPKDMRWQQPVEWVGKVKERKIAGAEVGNRLYAGRKRMFKGHKWERMAEKRAIRRRMLLRDMPKRIVRYKQ